MLLGILAHGPVTSSIYPYSLPVTAPGTPGVPSSFDASAWTAYVQGPMLASDTLETYGGGDNGRPWYGQIIDIPSSLWTDVDAGLLKATSLIDVSSGTDSDTASFGIDCLASDFTYLGGNQPAFRQGNNTTRASWTELSTETFVPVGTRKLRIHQRCVRFTGTDNSIYWRNIRVNLELSGYVFESLYAMRGVVRADWTNRSGTPLGSKINSWGVTWNNTADETGLDNSFGVVGGGQGSSWSVKREYLISNLSSAAQAAHTTGNLSALFQAWALDDTNQENGGIYLRPHTTTSGDADIIQDQNAFTSALKSYGVPMRLTQEPLDSTVARIEFFFYGTRDGGSYADSAFNYTHLGVYYPAP